MSYLGNSPPSQNFVAGADQFSGTGSQLAFTLSRNVNTVFDIFVTVSNVPQDPFTAYTVAGNTLTFDGAPPAGTNNIDVVYRATNVQTFVPSPGVSPSVGNLNFIGTGNRITGDFSNATVANRVNFQTSTLNNGTYVSTLPNGTDTNSGFFAYNATNGDNAAFIGTYLNNSLAIVNSGKNGTGTFLPMTFYTGGSERMRIDTSGNINLGANYINLASPNGVNGDWVGGYNINYSSGIKNVLTGFSNGVYQGSSGFIAFHTNTSQTAGTTVPERARITSDGYLLLGKTTTATGTAGSTFGATADLGYSSFSRTSSANTEVTLQVYSTGAAANRFYVGMAGTVFATSTTITGISDVRLKENIRDLDDGLNAVLALQPRKFDWKEGKGANIKNARGFIAQEFEQVFPDMIEQWIDEPPEGEEPYKAVNANLIPTLVKAIQELNAKVEAQAAEIAALKGNA